MRIINTERPSFPEVHADELISWPKGERWNVVCGDTGHWRAGVFAPPESKLVEVAELERHDCPELFLLIQGRVTLVLSDKNGGVRELPLETGKPVLVESPHSAFCPDGPHTGTCFVVERDAFKTEYRVPADWKTL